jgi:hypothetical protein
MPKDRGHAPMAECLAHSFCGGVVIVQVLLQLRFLFTFYCA